MYFAVLALLTALVLCACGGTSGTAQTESSPYAGTWTATSASYGETDVPIEEVFAEGMSLELQSNGVCQLTLGEQSDPATWSAVDGAITISDGETDFLGTLRVNDPERRRRAAFAAIDGCCCLGRAGQKTFATGIIGIDIDGLGAHENTDARTVGPPGRHGFDPA